VIAVDSSALIAVALAETDADKFIGPLEGSVCLIGWPTLLEVHLVLTGYDKKTALAAVDYWRSGPLIRTIDFDQPLFGAAVEAFDRFGKGIGHPAGLNFGDCMAYAIAKLHDVPLLYKGSDFAHTDIVPALS
jgi:ribonuclease VapC